MVNLFPAPDNLVVSYINYQPIAWGSVITSSIMNDFESLKNPLTNISRQISKKKKDLDIQFNFP